MWACMHECRHGCGYCFNHAWVHCCLQVLLACRLYWWPGHNIDERLSNAFSDFDTWRRSRRLSISITKFELKTFKCTSHLSCIMFLLEELCMITDPWLGYFFFFCKAKALRLATFLWQGLWYNGALPMVGSCDCQWKQWSCGLVSNLLTYIIRSDIFA